MKIFASGDNFTHEMYVKIKLISSNKIENNPHDHDHDYHDHHHHHHHHHHKNSTAHFSLAILIEMFEFRNLYF